MIDKSNKPTVFNYWYWWHICPFINLNAFGFWRVWFAEFELYYFHDYQGFELRLDKPKQTMEKSENE